MAINVEFQLGNFPPDFCFQSAQQYADALIALLTGTIAGNFSGVIIGANPPAVSDQDKLWVKTDGNGRPAGIFLFNGQWIWPHPVEPSEQSRMIWVGTEAQAWSYDGGDGSDPGTVTPTATTGAMWQRDTNFDFRLPIGIGTSPNTYDGNPATTVSVQGVGGAERVTLASDENGAHSHKMFSTDAPTSDQGIPGAGESCAVECTGVGTNQAYKAQKSLVAATLAQTSSVGSKSHQNMPPYYGVIFLKRTARQFYVGG